MKVDYYVGQSDKKMKKWAESLGGDFAYVPPGFDTIERGLLLKKENLLMTYAAVITRDPEREVERGANLSFEIASKSHFFNDSMARRFSKLTDVKLRVRRDNPYESDDKSFVGMIYPILVNSPNPMRAIEVFVNADYCIKGVTISARAHWN
jgi:hypothetical protein